MIDGDRFARFFTFALVLLFCGSTVAYTRAQPLSERLEKAKLLFEEGQKAYVQGELTEALDSFRDAHRLVPSAELAYNIGHISEQLGNFEDAIRFLRLYLSRSLSSAKDQEEIETRIDRLRERVRDQREQLSRQLRIPTVLTEKERVVLRKAVAVVKQGRYRAALALFTIALRQNRLPEIHYDIAKMCEQLGRTQDAVTNYRAYLETRRHAVDKKAIEKKIAELVAVVSE